MGREHRIDVHRRRSQYPGWPRASDALFWWALKCQGFGYPGRICLTVFSGRETRPGVPPRRACQIKAAPKDTTKEHPCVVQRLTKYQRKAQQIRAGRSCSEFSYVIAHIPTFAG